MCTKKVFTVAVSFITFFVHTTGLLAKLVDFQNVANKYSNCLISSADTCDFITSKCSISKKQAKYYVNTVSFNASRYVDDQYIDDKTKSEEVDVLNVKTLIDDISVNKIDSLTKDELIKKEIQKLNQELDELNEKLKSLKNENKLLKDEIEKYNNEDKLKVKKQTLIENLKKEARSFKVNLDLSYVPDKYISALDLLIIGDIDLAQKQFLEFINFQTKSNKSKEYLNSTSSGQTNIFIASSYYWLGRINNINRDYKYAVENFSLAYKYTDFSSLSLISLTGLIDSFTNLSQNAEACATIKQFMQDYKKASSNKGFTLNQYYLKLVENFKIINKCQ